MRRSLASCFLLGLIQLIGCADGASAVKLSAPSSDCRSAAAEDHEAAVTGETVKGPIFRDDFEYEVDRSANNAEVTFRAHGWSDVKANNSYYQRGAGFIFTQFDSTLGSRVLVMESRPSMAKVPPGFGYAQTDYYLKYGKGEGALASIPSCVWIQFWTYATPESRFSRRDKTIYPCRGPYPCGRGQLGWLFMWGSSGFESAPAPPGGRFLALEGERADFRGDLEYPTKARKLFQNVEKIPLLAGRWYQVRLHLDVSGEQGIYEAWIREKEKPWRKVAEWIGGVTKNFLWPIPVEERAGFSVLAMPTTVNGPGDSITYLDDFVLSAAQKDLP